MTNIEKISEFLTQAKVFTFLTVDNGQPKGRPFGFHLVDGDRIYFGTGTFKNCFKQLSADPHVEVMAVNDGKFMRYDGLAKIVKDDALLAKVHELCLSSWKLTTKTAGRSCFSISRTVMLKFADYLK